MTKSNKPQFATFDVEALDAVAGGLGSFRLAMPILAGSAHSLTSPSLGGLPLASELVPHAIVMAPAPPVQPLAFAQAPTDLVGFSATANYFVNSQHGVLSNTVVPTANGTVTLNTLASQLAARSGGAIVFGGDLNHDGRISAEDFLHARGYNEAAAARDVGYVMDQLRAYSGQGAPSANALNQLLNSFNRMFPSQQGAARASSASRPATSQAQRQFSSPSADRDPVGAQTNQGTSDAQSALFRGQEIARQHPLSPNDDYRPESIQRIYDANGGRPSDAAAEERPLLGQNYDPSIGYQPPATGASALDTARANYQNSLVGQGDSGAATTAQQQTAFDNYYRELQNAGSRGELVNPNDVDRVDPYTYDPGAASAYDNTNLYAEAAETAVENGSAT